MYNNNNNNTTREARYHAVGDPSKSRIIGDEVENSRRRRRVFLSIIGIFLLILGSRSIHSASSSASSNKVKKDVNDDAGKISSMNNNNNNDDDDDDEVTDEIKESSVSKIKSVHLIGERHSGTKWIYDHLRDCFGHDGELEIINSLTRKNYLFQYPPKLSPHRNITSRASIPPHTLILTQFVNPYDWIESMRLHPLHAPLHQNLDWKSFVSRSWTMPRWGDDVSMNEEAKRGDKRICGGKFRYWEVIPCSVDLYDSFDGGGFGDSGGGGGENDTMKDGNKPRYELKQDGTGRPYNSILELRSDKIQNFLNTRTYDNVDEMMILRVEDLILGGTESLLKKMEDSTGVSRKCQPLTTTPPPPELMSRRRIMDPEFVRYINENLNWEREKLLGYERIDPESLGTNSTDDNNNNNNPTSQLPPGVKPLHQINPTIRTIHFIGERHSGTNWIYDHLIDCFSSQVNVMKSLGRFKHWMQWNDPDKVEEGSMVVAIFRNSYEWVEALRKVPYQAPNHVWSRHEDEDGRGRKKMNWTEFVTTEWSMDRWGEDLNVTDREGRICHEKFRFDEVIPCLKELKGKDSHPLYELNVDGSGRPYGSVVDLRKDKILNFLDTADYENVVEHFVVRFEDFVAEGSEAFLDDVEKRTGLVAGCKPLASEATKRRRRRRRKRRLGDGGKVGDEVWMERFKSRKDLDPAFVRWMNENVDWDVEERIGYKKMSNLN